MTGIHLYIDKNGQIGIKYAGNSDSVTYRLTNMNFSSYRRVTIEDNTNENIIYVYFNNDNGDKTLVATCAMDKGVVTFVPAVLVNGQAQKTVQRDYGYNFYRNGYLSVVTSQAYDVEIANMSVTVAQYSTVAFPVDVPETDTVSITGVLKDTEDKPLAGYTVEIRSPLQTVVTNSKGEFSFQNVAMGSYTLTVRNAAGEIVAETPFQVIRSSKTYMDGVNCYLGQNVSAFSFRVTLNGDKLIFGDLSTNSPATGDEWPLTVGLIIPCTVLTIFMMRKRKKIK
jgi:hypothetical protein